MQIVASNQKVVKVAVDAMGGDFATEVTVPAAIQALKQDAGLFLYLVGVEAKIQEKLDTLLVPEELRARFEIINASQIITMDEAPLQALRQKRQASMRLAVELVHEAKADACVSAGNTGALMAIARLVLGMLPGILRPAIISAFPTSKDKPTYMLDLGANVDNTAEHLLQFAVMASILLTALGLTAHAPTVAILNVGVEAIKGNELVKLVHRLLQEANCVNYVGFIEANHICHGTVDIIVCDGFTGNIALKACEGAVNLILQAVKQALRHNYFTKLLAFCMRPVLKAALQPLDPNRYNGGMLLGLQGVVIKSHGGANIDAFTQAINIAARTVRQQVTEKIIQQMQEQENGIC